VSILLTESKKQTDLFLLRLPRPRLGHPKPRAWLWSDAEQNAARHRRDFVPFAARARLRPLHAGRVPDRGAPDERHVLAVDARRIFVCVTRGPPAIRACAESA
jgi:hypothetical protein